MALPLTIFERLAWGDSYKNSKAEKSDFLNFIPFLVETEPPKKSRDCLRVMGVVSLTNEKF